MPFKFPAASLRARLFRLACSTSSPSALIIMVVAIGLFLPRHFPGNDNAADHHAPLPEFPTSKTADIHNEPKRTGPDLDGIAVVFAEEATNLIVAEGRFRTDLTVEQFSKTLNIEPQSISLPDGKMNPDAVLFRAQAATLTSIGKAKSLEMRKRQSDPIPWAVYAEWERQDFGFTLNKMRNPSNEELMILNAISRVPPFGRPSAGDGIKATGINRGQFEIQPNITGGMLPYAALPHGVDNE
jgi:hypothetical protein